MLMRADGNLDGQIYNVFEVIDGRFVSVRDVATREDAVRSAGIQECVRWR